VRNLGLVDAGGFVLSSWFDRAMQPGCGDGGSVTENIALLAAGGSLTFNYSFNQPLTTGAFTARAFADATCVIAELDEANNHASAVYSVNPPPDLVIESILLNQSSFTPGETATATIVVRNQGSGSTGAGFAVELYRSSTLTAACNQPGDARSDRPALAAGGTQSVAVTFVVPSTAGTHTARAFADYACVIAESIETNNQSTVSYSVVNAQPDLNVTTVTVSPTSAEPGTAASVTVIVRNDGAANAPPFQLSTWFTAPTQPACGNSGSINEPIAGLAAGATLSRVYTFTFPATVGTNYARAFADSQCVLAEPNETNNQRARSYTVRGADLAVNSLSITPASAVAGAPASLTVVIQNVGNQAANNFTLSAWFERSSAPSCGNVGSVTQPITSLAAGASMTFVYTFNFSATPGTKTARAYVDSDCVVPETTEGNNQSSRTYTVLRTDVAVNTLSITPSVGFPGTAATVTVRVSNTGSHALDSFTLNTWLMRNTQPDCGETGDRTETVPPLAAGASVTFNYAYVYPNNPGTQTIWSFADSACQITETDEVNNRLSRTYFVAGPDVTVTAATVTPSSGALNAPASLTVIIRNSGSQAATNFRLESWYSRATAPGCGDSGDRSETIASLPAGATMQFVYSFTMPTQPGTYTAWSFVDAGCSVAETNETNNIASRSYTARGPDLVVTAATVTTTNPTPGALSTLTVTVRNLGSLTATNFFVDSWFSRDTAPGCGETGDRTEFIASLPPNGSATFRYLFNRPSLTGSYTAWAFADSGCTVAEMSEANNQVSHVYHVTGIDLNIASILVSPTAGPPGSAATLTVTVRNSGTMMANNVRVDFWFDHPVVPVCGDVGTETRTISSLAGGGTTTFVLPFTRPPVYGTYNARAFVDPLCVIAETSETNNVGTRAYTVPGPDLTVLGMTVTPTTGPIGAPGTLTVVLRNIGSFAAENFDLGVWFMLSSAPTCGNPTSLTQPVASLAAGASSTFNIPFNFPSAAGTVTARAYVDWGCAVTETSETNNAGSRAYRILVPDLKIAAMTVTPASGAIGAPATLSVTIRNDGTADANNFELSSWFTRTTNPACNNPASVTDFVSSLPVGASITFLYPFTRPATTGTHTARAMVDGTCLVLESNEGNNLGSVSYSVSAAASVGTEPASDSLEFSVMLNKTEYAPGELGVATVALRNNGAIRRCTDTVAIYRHTGSTSPYAAKMIEGGIEAGATVTVTFQFVNFVADGNYTFKARLRSPDGCSEHEATIPYRVALPAPAPVNTATPSGP
jgi:subtilase family serine protease